MSSITDTLRKISAELGSNRNILKNLQTLCQIRAPSEVFAQFDFKNLIQGIKFMKAQKSTEQLRVMVLKKLEISEKAVYEKENQAVVPGTEKPLQAKKRKTFDEEPAPPHKKAAPPPPAALKAAAAAPAPAPVRRQLNLGQDQMLKNMVERHRQKAEAIAAGKLKAAENMADRKRAQQERIREAQARKNGEIVEEQPKGRAKAPRRY